MARYTTKVSQARDKILSQSKELAKIVQLKSFLRSQENNLSIFQANEEDLKNELAAAIKDSTWLSQFADDTRVEVVDLREKSVAKNGVICPIVENSCASLGSSLRVLAESFTTGINKSVNESFPCRLHWFSTKCRCCYRWHYSSCCRC